RNPLITTILSFPTQRSSDLQRFQNFVDNVDVPVIGWNGIFCHAGIGYVKAAVSLPCSGTEEIFIIARGINSFGLEMCLGQNRQKTVFIEYLPLPSRNGI